jgi:hypothetical protein
VTGGAPERARSRIHCGGRSQAQNSQSGIKCFLNSGGRAPPPDSVYSLAHSVQNQSPPCHSRLHRLSDTLTLFRLWASRLSSSRLQFWGLCADLRRGSNCQKRLVNCVLTRLSPVRVFSALMSCSKDSQSSCQTPATLSGFRVFETIYALCPAKDATPSA